MKPIVSPSTVKQLKASQKSLEKSFSALSRDLKRNATALDKYVRQVVEEVKVESGKAKTR